MYVCWVLSFVQLFKLPLVCCTNAVDESSWRYEEVQLPTSTLTQIYNKVCWNVCWRKVTLHKKLQVKPDFAETKNIYSGILIN